MALKTLCVIPARGGSKGIPRKNIRILGGKPLIGHVITAALESAAFDKVVLSTDDDEIATVARREYPEIEVPFKRDAALADDKTPLPAVSCDALEYFADEAFDAVFSLQPTNPFTRPETLRRAVELINYPGVDSVVSVSKIVHQHPFRAYKLDPERLWVTPLTEYTKESFPQKQDRPDAYGFTGALYGRRSYLFQDWPLEGFVLGDRVAGVVVSEEEGMDVDTPFDLEVCQALFHFRQHADKNI